MATGGSVDPLDEGYRTWVASLSDDERAAVVAWQRADDRHYAEIQSLFRGGEEVPTTEVLREIDTLDDMIARASLPCAVPQAWKGVRNVERVFGKPLSDLQPGDEVQYAGFFALTDRRAVAVGEFAHPPGPPRAGVLRMSLHERAPLAWISGAGDEQFRYQRELLASDGVWIRFVAVTYPDGAGHLPEIEVEVRFE